MSALPGKGLLAARYIGIAVVLGVFLFPIFWMVTIALKPEAEWTTFPLIWLPRHPTLGNFKLLFSGSSDIASQLTPATKSMWNSLIAAPVGTLIAMMAGTPAAFAISKFRTGGAAFPFQILSLRMFPPVVIVIPLFIMWTYVGLYDSQFGLALIYALLGSPFVVWLMKSFFDSLPREIFDAALMDGCSLLSAFVKSILPLVKAGLAVTALFVFILSWSDFGAAFILTSSRAITMPVQLQLYQSSGGTLYGPQAALGLLAIIPPVVIGLAIQRYLAAGLTFGAVKE